MPTVETQGHWTRKAPTCQQDPGHWPALAPALSRVARAHHLPQPGPESYLKQNFLSPWCHCTIPVGDTVSCSHSELRMPTGPRGPWSRVLGTCLEIIHCPAPEQREGLLPDETQQPPSSPSSCVPCSALGSLAVSPSQPANEAA